MSRCLTYRYALSPTARQVRALDVLLRHQCELYNAALEERRGAWRLERRTVSHFDQCKTLTGLREVRPEVMGNGVVVCRGTLKRLDRAFKAFYRRCKSGDTPGFPRFKSAARWDSVQWEDINGCAIIGNRLRLFGIGHIKVNLHRPIVGTPKAITVAREGRRWWVSVRCVDVPANPLPATGREAGLDLGVASLITTSAGEHIENPRYFARGRDNLAAEQQSLARKQRGSNRRKRQVERVAASHRSIRNQRTDHAHKLSRALVNGYDLIVHEDLKIANMVRRAAPKPDPGQPGAFLPNGGSVKSGLNRSIQDAGWGQLIAFISYKAESAGREVIAVNPRHTSQRCARCGHVAAGNRVTQAKFQCESCGHSDHADVNAAINILRAGRARRDQTREGSPAA